MTDNKKKKEIMINDNKNDHYNMLKYETFISDIHQQILDKMPAHCGYNDWNSEYGKYFTGIINSSLDLIFDYGECNDFARIIMDKTPLLYTIATLTDEKRYEWDDWEYMSGEHFDSLGYSNDVKVDAARSFVKKWRRYDKSSNYTEAFRFIFWSLAILTVDKKDIEEHMLMISNFVKMLCIEENELLDIIQIVKLVFGNNEMQKYVCKTDTIYKSFCGINGVCKK